MISDEPVLSTWIEAGFTSVGDQDWTVVSTSITSFTSASVFVSLPGIPGATANVSFPATARVRNVVVTAGVGVSFETRLYQPNGSSCEQGAWRIPEEIAPVTLSWMVAERGAFNVSGHMITVGSGNVSKTDDTYDIINFPRIDFPTGCAGLTAVCAYPSGTDVGVILQIQTLVYDRMLIPRARVVGLRFFRAFLQVTGTIGLSDHSMPIPERVGFMSFSSDLSLSCVERFTLQASEMELTDQKQSLLFEFVHCAGAPCGCFGFECECPSAGRPVHDR
jgi:hypothetical protein